MLTDIQHFINRYKIILLFAILFVLIDQYFWAMINPWGIDEATNVWIGMKIPLKDLVSGYNSSRGYPHPNGMPLIGYLLSFLPSLLWVGYFLGILFSLTLIFFVSSVVPEGKKRNLILFSLLSFVYLRSNYASFGNSTFIAYPVLFFFITISNYLKTKLLIWLNLAIALIMITPTFWLAGMPAVFAMAGITLIIIIICPPLMTRKNITLSIVFFLILLACLLWLVWIPYFKSIDIALLRSQPRPSFPFHQIYYFLQQIFLLPYSFIFTMFPDEFRPSFYWVFFKSKSLIYYLDIANIITWRLQSIIFFFTIGASLIYNQTELKKYLNLLKNIKYQELFSHIFLPLKSLDHFKIIYILIFIFMLLLAGFTPALGGMSWSSGHRQDLLGGYYLIFYWSMILAPFIFKTSKKLKLYLTKGMLIISFIGIMINIVSGWEIIRLTRLGDEFINNQVNLPILEQEMTIDAIVNDALTKSPHTKKFSIEYNFGDGGWDWIPKLGSTIPKSLKYPYSIGRSFDYILWKKYQLENIHDGLPDRPKNQSRYKIMLIDSAADRALIPNNFKKILKVRRFKIEIDETKNI